MSREGLLVEMLVTVEKTALSAECGSWPAVFSTLKVEGVKRRWCGLPPPRRNRGIGARERLVSLVHARLRDGDKEEIYDGELRNP